MINPRALLILLVAVAFAPAQATAHDDGEGSALVCGGATSEPAPHIENPLIADVGPFVLRMLPGTSDHDFDYVVDYLEVLLPPMIDILGEPEPIDTLTVWLTPTNRPSAGDNFITMDTIKPSIMTRRDRSWDNLFIHELTHEFHGPLFAYLDFRYYSWVSEGLAEASRHFVAEEVFARTGLDVRSDQVRNFMPNFDLIDLAGPAFFGGPAHVVNRLDQRTAYLCSAATFMIPVYAEFAAGHHTPHPLGRVLQEIRAEARKPRPRRLYDAIDRAWSAPVDGIFPPSRWVQMRSVTVPWTSDGAFTAVVPFNSVFALGNVNPKNVQVYDIERRDGEVESTVRTLPMRYTSVSGAEYWGAPAYATHSVPSGLPAGAYSASFDVAESGAIAPARTWFLVTEAAADAGPITSEVAVIFVDPSGKPVDPGHELKTNGRLISRVPGAVIVKPLRGDAGEVTFWYRGRRIGSVTASADVGRVVTMPLAPTRHRQGVADWYPYRPLPGERIEVSFRRSWSALGPDDGVPVQLMLRTNDGRTLSHVSMTPQPADKDLHVASLQIPPDFVEGMLDFEGKTSRHGRCLPWHRLKGCYWMGHNAITTERSIPSGSAFFKAEWLHLELSAAYGAGEIVLEQAPAPEGPWQEVETPGVRSGETGYAWRVVAARGSFLQVLAVHEDASRQLILQTRIEPPPAASTVRSVGVYPNPSAAGVSWMLEVSGSIDIEYSIYDVAGRLVSRSAGLSLQAGSETLRWDGRVGDAPVPAGVYFLRIVGPAVNLTEKVIVVR